MPIISSTSKMVKTFDVTMMDSCGHASIVHVHPNHSYDITYTKNGKIHAKTGRIIDVVQDFGCGKNSHIVFDWSGDMSSRRESIPFSAVCTLRDLTPNNAYQLALEEGFEGTLDDWFESMRGKNNYELAVENGFEGTVEEYLESLKGDSKLTDEQVAWIVKWVEQAKAAEAEEGEDPNGKPGSDHPVTVIPSPNPGEDGEGEGDNGGSDDGSTGGEGTGDGSNGSDPDETGGVQVPPETPGTGDSGNVPGESSGDGSGEGDGKETPSSDGADDHNGLDSKQPASPPDNP